MSLTDPQIWLSALALPYIAVVLHWARVANGANARPSHYFTAGGELAPWMTVVVMAGMSLSGFVVLGFAQMIATSGFGFATLSLAGVVMAFAGVLVFKRQWVLARHYGAKSLAALLDAYYDEKLIVVVVTGISILFAVAFAPMQLRILGFMLSDLSGGALPPIPAMWSLAVVLGAYVVIGGLRAAGYLGVIQSVLLAVGVIGLAAATLVASDGFGGLNAALAGFAGNHPDRVASLFEVSGVVQFVAGLGKQAPVGSPWTAAMVLSMALALMGIQVSPMATQLLVATRSARGIAAGQTWVMAGFFGLLVVGGVVIVGAYGLMSGEALPVAARLNALVTASPWFAAGLFTCLVAAVQVVASIALVTASANLVYDIYKPLFHKGLEDRLAILYGRVAAGVILLVGLLLATSTPAALDALGGAALPISVQLLPALLGLCWIRSITRQGAAVGLVIGIVAVVLTEPLGIAIFEFLGLSLPWGRWPWTIHSAGWGLFFNVVAVIVVSLITQRRGRSALAGEMHAFSRAQSSQTSKSRALKPAAWSAALAWFFLAVGPGLVMGNSALGGAGEGLAKWMLGMPSLWGWSVIGWATGVLLIWFLAYKLELSTAVDLVVTRRPEPPRMPDYDHAMKTDELHRLLWTVAAIGAAVTLVAWAFG